MPSEPDNRMDDLLKAYAKKRRGEAGAPSEMHPATRRLLQDEAAKLRPKGQDRKASWFSAFLAFSPRYASAAVALVLVGVGAWSFFHFGQPVKEMAFADTEARQATPRPESAPALASAEKKESGVRELREADNRLDEPQVRLTTAAAPAEPQPLAREELSDRLKIVVDESKTKRASPELAANEALQKNLAPGKPASFSAPTTPPPAPVTAPAMTRDASAPPQLASVDAKDQVSLKGSQSLSDDYAKLPLSPAGTDGNALRRQNAPTLQPLPPGTAPQVPAVGVSGMAAQQAPAATSLTHFYSQEGVVAQTGQNLPLSRNRFSQTPAPSRNVSLPQGGRPAVPVLAEFDFEQSGNRVRVVDADGSVYDGLIEDAKADFDNNAKAAARRDSLSNVEQRKVGNKPGALAENVGADSLVLNFRASGTNRTLQQQVRINGVLYGNSTNVGGQADQSVRGAVQQNAQQIGNANLAPVQRIQGRVQVGTAAETQLDAVRR